MEIETNKQEASSIIKSTGANLYGQLGRKGPDSAVEAIPKFIKENIPIICIAAGTNHCAAVSLGGNLFTWEGECGFNSQVRSVIEPTQVPDFSSRHVVKAACGGHFTIAITASMETFIFGTVDLVSRKSVFSSFIPHQIGKYVNAFAGWAHGALLDDKGKLFMFGSGCFWRLGNGSKNDVSPHLAFPLDIPEKVISAALGADFSLVLTENGKVYSFGSSENGEVLFISPLTPQLGHGNLSSHHKPTLIKFFENKKIIKISAGVSHCAAIDSNYQLYTWGNSDCGQLGHNSLERETSPKLVAALNGMRVVDVGCGNHHTAFITDDGSPFIIGSFGPPIRNSLPRALPFVSSASKIASNGMHVLISEGFTGSINTAFLQLVNNSQYSDFKFSINKKTYFGHSIFLSRVPDYEKLLEDNSKKEFIQQKVLDWLTNVYGINSVPTDLFKLPKESIPIHLGKFVNQSKFSDVQFRFPDEKNQVIFAHKAILTTRSSYFKGMLEGGLKEAQSNIIDIKSVKMSVYLSLMQYLYCGNLKVKSPDDCIDLLMLTEEYNLPNLKSLCEMEIIEQVEVENAAYMFALANLYRASTLKSKCVLFIKSNIKAVEKSATYKDLSKQDLETLTNLMSNVVLL